MRRGEGLAPQHRLELFRRQRLQHAVVEDPSRVHDTGQVRYLIQQPCQRGPVGDVTGRDRHPRAERGQLLHQVPGTRRLNPTPAGEQQVRHAFGGEPAGDVGAQRTGAAGHQHRARRRHERHVTSGDGPLQTAAEHPRGADRDLVLGALRQHGGQPVADAGVERLGQVDEATPLVAVLQRGGPAQAPDLGLDGAAEPVGATGGHGAAGEPPDRRVQTRVAERLHEGGRADDTLGHGGETIHCGLGEAEQRHDAGDVGGRLGDGVEKVVGEEPAVRICGGVDHGDRGAGPLHRVGHVAGVGHQRHDEQPRAG
ncbi:hypothetical protein GCM10027610_000080 [Dactylosporangium cerinum]